MKRISLLTILLILSPASRACDSLLGTWQSDATSTMDFNRAKAKLEPRQDEFLASLMGKMTIEFTSKDMHLKMPDTQVSVGGEARPFVGIDERNAYRVLFCDARMVVIAAPDAVTGEDDVSTYFFSGPDAIWVYMGTNRPEVPDLHAREYFRRIKR